MDSVSLEWDSTQTHRRQTTVMVDHQRIAPIVNRPPFDPPCSIELSALHTDDRYVPSVRESLVEQIVQEGWHPTAAGSIRVNQRPDGSYWVLDGWNRVEAARRLRETRIWVEIYHFKTPQEEGYWSRRWNGKMAILTALEKFRTGLEAGEVNKVAISTIVKRHGFRITNSRLLDYSLSAVKTLEKIYNLYGPVALDQVLEVISESWSGEPESTTEDIIKAVLILIALYAEDLREDDLIFRLREHKASWWRREAEGDRGDYPLFIKLADRFLRAYNHYKHSGRGGKLPEFDPQEAMEIL